MKDCILHKYYQIKPAIIVIILLVFVLTLFSFGCKAESSNGDLPSEAIPSVETIAPSESISPEPSPSEEPVVEPAPGKVAFPLPRRSKIWKTLTGYHQGKLRLEIFTPGQLPNIPSLYITEVMRVPNSPSAYGRRIIPPRATKPFLSNISTGLL
jgi:hypothetical protein